ncbi:hypothetical protein QU24_19550 [Pantoea rodasii]|uniref:Uncharacterized protein n=1 Tax=Pantoea rodasii TaxID=1076549 RepID=A0A0B1R5A4_9GAMM|nr:hypothetical protein QU24_19550 [Pantoea rodasii]
MIKIQKIKLRNTEVVNKNNSKNGFCLQKNPARGGKVSTEKLSRTISVLCDKSQCKARDALT